MLVPSSGKHACTAHEHVPYMGLWVKICNSSAGKGGRDHRQWQHPCGALSNASVHERPHESCMFMVSLHAIHPGHWGLHMCTLTGTLAPCGPQSHILCACCCAVLVPPGMCVHQCEVWASLHACAHPGSQCLCQGSLCPAVSGVPPSCPACGVPTDCPQHCSPSCLQ